MEAGRWKMEAKEKELRRRLSGFLKSVSPDFRKINFLSELGDSAVKKLLEPFYPRIW
jgi:hypothetical protein